MSMKREVSLFFTLVARSRFRFYYVIFLNLTNNISCHACELNLNCLLSSRFPISHFFIISYYYHQICIKMGSKFFQTPFRYFVSELVLKVSICTIEVSIDYTVRRICQFLRRIFPVRPLGYCILQLP